MIVIRFKHCLASHAGLRIFADICTQQVGTYILPSAKIIIESWTRANSRDLTLGQHCQHKRKKLNNALNLGVLGPCRQQPRMPQLDQTLDKCSRYHNHRIAFYISVIEFAFVKIAVQTSFAISWRSLTVPYIIYITFKRIYNVYIASLQIAKWMTHTLGGSL